MRVFNETPYQVGHWEAMYEPGEPFMSLIIKGSFRIIDGGACTALPPDKQQLIHNAETYLDKHGNSHKTPMDAAPFKRRGEWLFIGSAHAPDGEPVEMLEASIAVGGAKKTISVLGHRQWVREADGSARLTDPEPFTEMPLRAEFSHGGIGSSYNEHGIGYAPLGLEAGAIVPAANIVAPGHVRISWDQDLPPVGFAMLPPELLPRRTLLGTYDDMWRVRRQPLPPADFDPGFFNAAPVDQQIEGFFKGDEEFAFNNLHPETPEFRTRLPGTKVRAFVNRQLDPDKPDELTFSEVITVLDTCTFDMPARVVTLSWRGTLEIQDRYHERVKHMLVVEEPVGKLASLNSYRPVLADKLVDKDALAAQQRAEEIKRENAEVDRKAREDVLRTLREGRAPADLIAEVEKQETIQDAQKVLTDWVEKMSESLNLPKA